MKKESSFFFKNRNLIAPLKIIAMENCRPLIEKVDKTIVDMRHSYLNKYAELDPSVLSRDYDAPSYLVEASCPRFSSGEAKGVIHSSVRGADLYIISDVTNSSMSFTISGEPHSDGYENDEVLLLKPENAILRPDITNMSRSIMKAYIECPDRIIPLSEEVPPTYDPQKYEFYGVRTASALAKKLSVLYCGLR